MKAEEAVTRMEPEILGCIDRHLRDRHQWSGAGDVRLVHHREHGLVAVSASSPWSCWTGAQHPHIPLPVAPELSWAQSVALGATQRT